MTVVGTLEAELKADPALWEAAMKRATESMEKLSARVEASSQKIRAGNKAAEEAAGALQRLQGSARDLGERFSKVGAVTSGMGAAFSSAVPQMQGAVSAAAGLAQAFASGGPLLAGLALAGSAIAALASSWNEARKAADEAVAAAEKRLADLDARVQKSADALQALRTGSSVEVIELRREEQAAITNTKAAAAAFRDVVAQELGGKMPTMQTIEAMDGVTEGGTRVAAAFRNLETAAAIQRRVQEDLANIVLRNQAQQASSGATGATGNARGAQAIAASPASARTIAELTPLQTAAFNAGDMEALNALLGENGAALETAAAGSLVLLRELMSLEQAGAEAAEGIKGLGDVMRDARRRADEQRLAEERLAMQRAGFAADAIGSIGSGTVGTLALTTAGGIAGAAAGGPGGAMVGQALGQLLGPIADKLMASIGVLEPVMESLGRVVSGLAPLFGLLGGILSSVVVPVLDLLAPVVLAVSQAVAAFQVPLLRIAQVLLPVFMTQLAILVPIVALVSDVFVALVEFIDTYVFMPIATAAVELYNAVVNAINGIIAGINGFLGAVGLAAISLGYLDQMGRPQSMLDMGISQQELSNSLDDNTEQLRQFNRSMTNVPAGFRYNLAEYRNEAPNGRSSPMGPRSMAARDGMVINGNVYLQPASSAVAEEIRRNMRQRGMPVGGTSSSNRSERN